jgi:hypothetical protein
MPNGNLALTVLNSGNTQYPRIIIHLTAIPSLQREGGTAPTTPIDISIPPPNCPI